MKIRFFNTYEPVSAFYRDLVPYLARQGVEVELVVSKAEYRKGRNLAKVFSNLLGIKMTRTFNFGFHAHSGRLAKAVVMAAYAIHATLYGLLGPNIEANVFLTQPPLIPVLGYLLSIIRKQPYYCVMMDIQPQMAVALGIASPESRLVKLLTLLSESSLRRAEGVIVIGRGMAKHVEAMGVSPERIHFIPNWADEQQISPVMLDENPLRQNQGWNGKFVVLYAGNLGIPQHFDDILAVAEQLKSIPELLFVFIGEGVYKNKIKAQVENRQLTNVVMLPFLHETYSLAEILSAGNLHFVTLKDACAGLAVPSKTYGIMAAGRPIIYQGTQESEIARMVLEEEIGIVVPCGDVERLKQVIVKYVKQPNLCQAQGQKARALVESSYSRIRALERYAEVLGIQNENTLIQPKLCKETTR